MVLNNDPMEQEIIQYLKLQAKSQGVTQEALARGLRVSLPTVKRWYSGKGITISNLRSICDYLGCSISEVFTSIEDSAANSFSYTYQQEQALVKAPRLLAFFDYLVRRKTVAFIRNKFQLSEAEVTSVLIKLDKLNLIELHPKNRVKLKLSGEPSWIPGGPLAIHFRAEILNDFIGKHEKENTNFYIHDYSDEDLAAIKSKLNELENFLKIVNKRTQKSSKSSQSYGAYFALKKFQWSMDMYLEN
jgi:transcriptional regulator with XRE-family HTH domain